MQHRRRGGAAQLVQAFAALLQVVSTAFGRMTTNASVWPLAGPGVGTSRLGWAF